MRDCLKLPFNATTAIPRGMIAAIVTSLDMRARPPLRPDPPGTGGFALVRLKGADLARYLAIYRLLGHRWMWFSRLIMAPDAVAAILDSDVAAWCLVKDGRDLGLLELDFRQRGECELAFFGLVDDAIGQGAGRWMMNRALEMAWGRNAAAGPISRLWVHTCNFDHPGAPAFYQGSGFRIFDVGIELAEDPRLAGHLPREAAPHVPILAP